VPSPHHHQWRAGAELTMATDKGPTMNRSRMQVATSYAPETLFTFEGGKGCFLSVPILTSQYNSPNALVVRRQIEEQMKEIITNWYNAGMNCRAGSPPPVYPSQVLEKSAFLDFRDQPSLDMAQFILLEPSQMGYHPDPLVFICSKCGLLHKYKDVDDFAYNQQAQERRADCKKSEGGAHTWVQVDVVFAHWSGNYEPLFPDRPCECGNNDFYLLKSTTGVFSDWKFKCSKDECPNTKELKIRDPRTKEILEEKMAQGANPQLKEIFMLPVSYRATSLHYVQADRFIPYPDASIFKLLHHSEEELAERLLSIYN
jgi:hypothetical protein